MKRLVIVITVIAMLAGRSLAGTCTPSGSNYIRSYRPQGHTPNYHPAGDAPCLPFMRDTTSDSKQAPLCFQCHPHQYQGWMRRYWQQQTFVAKG